MPSPSRAPDRALTKRIVSGVILAVLALADVIAGGWFFMALVILAVWLMAVEWARIARAKHKLEGAGKLDHRLMIAMVALVCVAGVLAQAMQAQLAAFAILAGGTIVAGLIAARRPALPVARTIGGIAYLGLPAMSLVWLRDHPDHGASAVIWLFLVVWTTDVMAFVAGRSLGGPKLAPSISPGKTWAGFVGGVGSAAAMGALVAGWSGGDVLSGGILGAFVVAALLAAISQGGDLFESSLKRGAGLKDSGSLIPGHGGVLDRLDGLLAAAPAFVLIILLQYPEGGP